MARRYKPKTFRTPEELGHLDGRKIGSLSHRVIGTLLLAGVRHPSPQDIFAAVGAHPLMDAVASYQRAGKQKLISLCSIYFGLLLPPEQWWLDDVEVAVDDTRLDLVWRCGQRRLVDELKTTAWPEGPEGRKTLRQVEREREAALAAYGDDFVGVRALFMRAPALSYFMAAGGERSPLGPWAPDLERPQ